MQLLVDIGNSRIKWAFAARGEFVAEGQEDREADGGLQSLLASCHSPDVIRIANVGGTDAGVRLGGVLGAHFGSVPVFARSAASGAGVRNGYTDPGQLGVDRWLAICAAVARYGSPLCVVDAGTATTIDVVGPDGEHRGGLILPGIQLMQAALWRNTGDLARLSAGGPDERPSSSAAAVPAGVVLGRDTAAGIRHGALQATAALVRAAVDCLPGGPMPDGGSRLLVLTGGAATQLATLLVPETRPREAQRPQWRLAHRPRLVLEGLALDPPCFQVMS